MINYSRDYRMKWLTAELQTLLHVASITSHAPTKKMVFRKIMDLR